MTFTLYHKAVTAFDDQPLKRSYFNQTMAEFKRLQQHIRDSIRSVNQSESDEWFNDPIKPRRKRRKDSEPKGQFGKAGEYYTNAQVLAEVYYHTHKKSRTDGILGHEMMPSHLNRWNDVMVDHPEHQIETELGSRPYNNLGDLIQDA